MANAAYAKSGGKFAKAQIDLLNHTIKAVLIDIGLYTVNLATHEWLSDIASGARVATATISSKTVSDDGVFDGADTAFVNPLNKTCSAIVIYKDTGNAATSPLWLWFDTVTGLLSSAANITVQWNASGIAKIGS